MRTGFTLVEVLVVLALLAVSAAVVVPALPSLSSTDSTQQAATEVLQVLRQARRVSLERGATVELVLDPANLAYRVDLNRDGSVVQLADGVLALPPGVTLVTSGPPAQFRFYPFGPATGEGVIIRDGPRVVTIQVDRWTGNVSLHRP